MDEGGDPQDGVEGEGGGVFREDDLPGRDGSGEHGLECAAAFFLRKEAHGDEGEKEEEVEPEVRGVKGDVDEAL